MGGLFSSIPSKIGGVKAKKRLREVHRDESPVRKRIRSTYEYIYSELFTKGVGSDLTIRALDHTWLLHRLYVKQISKQYNLPQLSRQSIQYLGDNLFLTNDDESMYPLLRSIPVECMSEVIKKPDLIVVQLEQDVLLLLLKWVFLQQHPDYTIESGAQLLEDAYSFFTSTGRSFLETPKGAVYVSTFQSIRWEYVVNVYKTAERMLRDHVVPEAWIHRVLARQWLRLLYAHDVEVKGYRPGTGHLSIGNAGSNSPSISTSSDYLSQPRSTHTAHVLNNTATQSAGRTGVDEPGPRPDLSEQVFWQTSERCGRRMLNGDATYSWRWTGFHFGFDVVVKYKRKVFSIVRFIDPHATEGAVSHASRLRLIISLRVRSLRSPFPNPDDGQEEDKDSEDNVPCLLNTVTADPASTTCDSNRSSPNRRILDRTKQAATSGVVSLSLEENKSRELLRLPDRFTFPAVVSVNLLRFDPIDWTSSSSSSSTDTNLTDV